MFELLNLASLTLTGLSIIMVEGTAFQLGRNSEIILCLFRLKIFFISLTQTLFIYNVLLFPFSFSFHDVIIAILTKNKPHTHTHTPHKQYFLQSTVLCDVLLFWLFGETTTQLLNKSHTEA